MRVSAQQASVAPSILDITADPTGRSTRSFTAAEAAAATGIEQSKVFGRTLSYKNGYRAMDSLRAISIAAGQRWLTQAQQAPIRGMQLDPAGNVSVVADQEALAKQQVAARLATPGLSLNDRAFTLSVAVRAFADKYAPARLATAETYLTQLEALGDTAAPWQFEAHRTMLTTYYALGRGADVIRHGTAAIETFNRMAFIYRTEVWIQSPVNNTIYTSTVEALTGQPGARAKIEHLNTRLRAAVVPTMAVLAADSSNALKAQWMSAWVEELIAANAKLGTPAAPMIAHVWLNMPSSDSANVPVNDGKIRVIEVANIGCPGCVWAMHGLQRLHLRFPEIQPVFLTHTFGIWGNRFVEPVEEVTHLRDYFLTQAKLTYPVGIWAGKKHLTEDEGMVPEESVNHTSYPLFGKPMLWIVDGKGIIRRIFTGYGEETDEQIAQTVQFLLREAGVTSTPAMSSNTVSSMSGVTSQ